MTSLRRVWLVAILMVLAAPIGAVSIDEGHNDIRPRHAAGAGPEAFLIRNDPDGNQTLLVTIEDDPGGEYAHFPAVQAADETVDAIGTYENRFLLDGTPTVALGSYVVVGDGAIIRTPHLLIEGTHDTFDAAERAIAAYEAGDRWALDFQQFLAEWLLPSFSDDIAAAPGAAPDDYTDHATLYVWTVARSTAVVTTFAGLTWDHRGDFTTHPDGTVDEATNEHIWSVATRINGETTRGPGIFLQETMSHEPGSTRQQARHIETGTVAGDGTRVISGAWTWRDERGTHSGHPSQVTNGTLVAAVGEASIPLVGLRTTHDERATTHGSDVTRITSVGPFIGGAYTPVVGLRYHSDTQTLEGTSHDLTVDINELQDNPEETPGGVGHPDNGNWEVDAGVFASGAFVPVAGLQHRTAFADGIHPYQAKFALGTYVGDDFVPLSVSTYDGSLPLTDWAILWALGSVRYETWRIATGTEVAGHYIPLVGVEADGNDPMGQRYYEHEFRVGVFLADYGHFVPLASLATNGNRPIGGHALLLAAGGGPGANAGSLDIRGGAYAGDEYVPVAEVQYRSRYLDRHDAEAWIVGGVYVGTSFVPLAGVSYESDAPLLDHTNETRSPDFWRVTVGGFVQGDYVPVVLAERRGGAFVLAPLPPHSA